jgi:hypothetical protein
MPAKPTAAQMHKVTSNWLAWSGQISFRFSEASRAANWPKSRNKAELRNRMSAFDLYNMRNGNGGKAHCSRLLESVPLHMEQNNGNKPFVKY